MITFGVCNTSVELRVAVIDAFKQRFLLELYVDCGVTEDHT
jgi:hypothetical protein